MKNIVKLLVSGIGCFAVVDVMPMMVVKKRQITSNIGMRKCSQDKDCPNDVRRKQIEAELIALQQAKLLIIEQSLHIELEDQFEFVQRHYELAVKLTKCDLDIYRNIKLFAGLEKEDQELKEKNKNSKRE